MFNHILYSQQRWFDELIRRIQNDYSRDYSLWEGQSEVSRVHIEFE